MFDSIIQLDAGCEKFSCKRTTKFTSRTGARRSVEPESTFARRQDICDVKFSINLVLTLVESPFLLLLLGSRKYEDCLLRINIMRARVKGY